MRTYRPTRFSPRVEVLESRICLSCDIDIIDGTTMRITGDASANQVVVAHDGAGNVAASCTGVPSGDAEAAGGITRIVIRTEVDNDNVDVDVTGELTTPLDLVLDLGTGNDDADVLFAGPISANLRVNVDLGNDRDQLNINLDSEIREGALVNIDVDGQLGRDDFILSVNEVRSAATLDVSFEGGEQNDVLDVRLGDPIDENAHVRIFSEGGNGHDWLSVDATTFGTGADIAAGATLDVKLHGNSGEDTLNFSYEGELLGDLLLNLAGGNNNDLVTANITLLEPCNAECEPTPEPTGRLRALVEGNDGHDDLTLNVFDLTLLGLADFFAVIDGGDGTDTCTSTPNVEERNCEL